MKIGLWLLNIQVRERQIHNNSQLAIHNWQFTIKILPSDRS